MMNFGRLLLRTGAVLSVLALVACMVACGSRMEKQKTDSPRRAIEKTERTERTLEKTDAKAAPIDLKTK